MIKGDQNSRTGNQNAFREKDGKGALGRWKVMPEWPPETVQCKACMTAGAPGNPERPSAQVTVTTWGASTALDTTSFPRIERGSSPPKRPLLVTLYSTSQHASHPAQPSTRKDPHSHLVLWVGGTCGLAGPGAEKGRRRHPLPLPHAWAHLQLLAPAVTACLPQLREQSQAVFTCPRWDHKSGGWEQSHHPTPPGHRLCLCPNLPLGRREAARPAHPATEFTPDQPLGVGAVPADGGQGWWPKGRATAAAALLTSSQH